MYINVIRLCRPKNISDKLDNQCTFDRHTLLGINSGVICEFDIVLPNTPYLVKYIC